MEHREGLENKEDLSCVREGSKLDNRSNWGEDSLDSLGSIESLTKLSPLTSKHSRISEIVRTNSLSPVQEGPPNMSAPLPTKPNLGELKPPIRHHHKNLQPGSGSSPSEKSQTSLNLGPIVSHNHQNSNSANVSPNSSTHKLPLSPRLSPGPLTSPRLNKKGSPGKEDSLSPNQSFSFSSTATAALGQKSKLDVPPLGEIAHINRTSNSDHSSGAAGGGVQGQSTISPRTVELSPLSSGRGVPSPRIPLGVSALQPLGAIRSSNHQATATSTAAAHPTLAPSPLGVEAEEVEATEASSASVTPAKKGCEETSMPSSGSIELDIAETPTDKSNTNNNAAVSGVHSVEHVELKNANSATGGPHVEVVESVLTSAAATSTNQLLEKPVSAPEHEASVVVVEAPIIRIVEATIAEPELLQQASTTAITSTTGSVGAVSGGDDAPSTGDANAGVAQATPVAEVQVVASTGPLGSYDIADTGGDTQAIADVAERGERKIETDDTLATTEEQQEKGDIGNQEEDGALPMETPPQSPRQAQASPHPASFVRTSAVENTTVVLQGPSTSTATADTNTPVATDGEVEKEVVVEGVEGSSGHGGTDERFPPPNTPVRGGAKMSRFSRSPNNIGGRNFAGAPLTLPPEQAPINTTSGEEKPGQTTSASSPAEAAAAPRTPSPRSPHTHSSSRVPGTPTLSPRAHAQVHASTPHTPSHAQFFKGRSTSNLSIAGSGISALHAHPPIQPLAAHKYEMSYNKAASDLRAALLRLDADETNSKQMVRNIFRKLDVNEHGELTAQELKNFVLSPELGLFEVDDPRAMKYATLLMEQIDINGDGSVSVAELEAFLWPPHLNSAEKNAAGPGVYSANSADFKEIGMILEFTRTAVRYHVSSVAALGSDEAILQEFGKLAKSSLKRGCLETKAVKKSFLNLKIPEFGRHLTVPEVDQLVVTLDCNDDGVVSAREFKEWLFPSHKQEDLNALSTYLKKLIAEHFHGDVWHMYRFFCNGSEQLHKNDFPIVLKTLDGSISRHEAQAMANRIAGSDKYITMANLLSVLGLVGRSVLTAADGVSIRNDADSTINTGSVVSGRSSRHRRSGSKRGKKLATHEEEAGFSESMDIADHEDGGLELQENDNDSDGLSDDASELSCDSGGLEGTDGLGFSDAAVRSDPAKAAAVADKNAPSEREKDIVREMLFGSGSSSRSPTSRLGNSLRSLQSLHQTQNQELTMMGDSGDGNREGVRKTVGLVPDQLVALGYTEHTGRWRGFPYDNWSCCETNLLECPVLSPSRQGYNSTGSSPNKNRLSVESAGSLHQHRTKSPPFRPAGKSPAKAPPVVVVEMRETMPPPPPAATPAQRRSRSTQRSPASASAHHEQGPKSASTVTAPGSAVSSRWSPVRRLTTTASHESPSRATPVIHKGNLTASLSSTGTSTSTRNSAALAPPSSRLKKGSTGTPLRSASPPPKVSKVDNRAFSEVKFKEAKKNKVRTSSTQPAKFTPEVVTTRPAQSAQKKTKAATVTKSTTASVQKNLPVTPSPQPPEPVAATEAIHLEVSAGVRAAPEPAPAAATDSAVAETDASVAQPEAEAKEEQKDCAPADVSAPTATVEKTATQENSTASSAQLFTSPTAEEPAWRSSTSPPHEAPPRVSATYQAPLKRVSVKAPPITAKFVVRVPPTAPLVVPPEVSDLFNRLRQPAPVVEAQHVKLQAPKWSGEVTHGSSTRKTVGTSSEDQPQQREHGEVEGRKCSSPVAQHIADMASDVSQMSGSQAFEATLQSLHSELDTIRRQSVEDEVSFSALLRENERHLHSLRQSFESSYAGDDNHHETEGDDDSGSINNGGERNNFEFSDRFKNLRISGRSFSSLHRTSRNKAWTAADYEDANKCTLSITLGPLDAPFLPGTSHSPNKYCSRKSAHRTQSVSNSNSGRSQQQRSQSAPARRYHISSPMNNSDSFFSADVSKLGTNSAGASRASVKATPKPRARSASPYRQSATRSIASVSASAGAGGITFSYKPAHDKGIWVPTSPLHGESFNRTRHLHWHKKNAAEAAKQAASRKSRSPSPVAVPKRPFIAQRSHSPSSRLPQQVSKPVKVVVNGVQRLARQPMSRTFSTPTSRAEIAPGKHAALLPQQSRSLSPPPQQYSSEFKQHTAERRLDSGGISPVYGVLPDQANPDRERYNILFESAHSHSQYPPVPPSPPPHSIPMMHSMQYHGMPVMSSGVFPSPLAYAPSSAYGASPASPQPPQRSAQPSPSYFPPSPSYAAAPPHLPASFGYPATGGMVGYPVYNSTYYAAPAGPPSSLGVHLYANQAFPSPDNTTAADLNFTSSSSSTAAFNHGAWWEAIQAQKRQHEKMAFESELSVRNFSATNLSSQHNDQVVSM